MIHERRSNVLSWKAEDWIKDILSRGAEYVVRLSLDRPNDHLEGRRIV
jgi:hypothetical protein